MTAFGTYELIERLGEGGMAEVWSAKKRGTGGFEKIVCIKRIRSDQRSDPGTAERFLREARVLGRLHHGNIGQIYDAGQVDDEYFIEMEYLRGKDLRTFLKAQLEVGPAPPGLGVALAIAVGRALDHAHNVVGDDGVANPIIHRDVTASNIMLCFDGGIKLVDFGLAKPVVSIDPKLTSTGVFVGTTGYIAPEVLRGAPATQKSDQFALGVVFYEALTGRRLLDAAVARERPPSECSNAIPSALDAICLRAIAEDPAARFVSCGAFVDAIEDAASNAALGARGVATLLAERFGDGKAKAAPVVASAAVARPVTPQPAPERPTTPQTPRARRKPRPSNRSTYFLAASIIVVSVLGASGVRLWREHSSPVQPVVPTAAVPAPATGFESVPDLAEARVDEPPPEAPLAEQKVRKKKAANQAGEDLQLMKAGKPKRHKASGDDMSLFNPTF